MQEVRECHRCDTAVAADSQFCHQCGEEVEGAVYRNAHERLRERLAQTLDDRYRVLELLGAGGMGVVFLADDLTNARKVAIKVLSPELAGDATIVARFHREARTAAALQHTNIVPIYSEASERGLHYYVMQHVDGRALHELLRDRAPASIELTLRVLREAAAALSHAHANGVVHRDVKPENIMIDGSGRVLLADFGISKVSQGTSGATTMLRLTDTGGVVGTPHYMAPEHALGHPVDGRADQYALAVVGFEMLTGKLPFDDETPAAIIHLHISTAAPKISSLRADVPTELEAAIARAMSKSPSHRFPNMDDFAAAIAAAAPVQRRPAHRILAIAAGVVLAVALAGGVWSQTNRPESPKDKASTSSKTAAAKTSAAKTSAAAKSVASKAATKGQTARLSVTATPTATVYIDGKRIGMTPIVQHRLASGTHRIRLERKGYRTKRDSVKLSGTQLLRRSYVLRREER